MEKLHCTSAVDGARQPGTKNKKTTQKQKKIKRIDINLVFLLLGSTSFCSLARQKSVWTPPAQNSSLYYSNKKG